MESRSGLSSALEALSQAVAALEAAAARSRSRGELAGQAETELALMRDDRAKLASDLDAALSRNVSIDTAKADISDRLDHAIAAVGAILARADRAGLDHAGPATTAQGMQDV